MGDENVADRPPAAIGANQVPDSFTGTGAAPGQEASKSVNLAKNALEGQTAPSQPPAALGGRAVVSKGSKAADETTAQAFKNLGFFKKHKLNQLLDGKYKNKPMGGTTKIIVKQLLNDVIDSINYAHENKLVSRKHAELDYFKQMLSCLSDEDQLEFRTNTEGLADRLAAYESNFASTTRTPEEVIFAKFIEHANNPKSDPADILDGAIRMRTFVETLDPGKLEEGSQKRADLIKLKADQLNRLDTIVDNFAPKALKLDKQDSHDIGRVIDLGNNRVMKPKERLAYERLVTKRLAVAKHARGVDQERAINDINNLKAFTPDLYAAAIANTNGRNWLLGEQAGSEHPLATSALQSAAAKESSAVESNQSLHESTKQEMNVFARFMAQVKSPTSHPALLYDYAIRLRESITKLPETNISYIVQSRNNRLAELDALLPKLKSEVFAVVNNKKYFNEVEKKEGGWAPLRGGGREWNQMIPLKDQKLFDNTFIKLAAIQKHGVGWQKNQAIARMKLLAEKRPESFKNMVNITGVKPYLPNEELMQAIQPKPAIQEPEDELQLTQIRAEEEAFASLETRVGSSSEYAELLDEVITQQNALLKLPLVESRQLRLNKLEEMIETLAPKALVLTPKDANELASIHVDSHRVMDDREYLQFERVLTKRLAILKYAELAGPEMEAMAKSDLAELRGFNVKYARVVLDKQQIPSQREPGPIDLNPKMIHGKEHPKNRLIAERAVKDRLDAVTVAPKNPGEERIPFPGLDGEPADVANFEGFMNRASSNASNSTEILLEATNLRRSLEALPVSDIPSVKQSRFERAERLDSLISQLRPEWSAQTPSMARTSSVTRFTTEAPIRGQKLAKELQGRDESLACLAPLVGQMISYKDGKGEHSVLVDSLNPTNGSLKITDVVVDARGETHSAAGELSLDDIRQIPQLTVTTLPPRAPAALIQTGQLARVGRIPIQKVGNARISSSPPLTESQRTSIVDMIVAPVSTQPSLAAENRASILKNELDQAYRFADFMERAKGGGNAELLFEALELQRSLSELPAVDAEFVTKARAERQSKLDTLITEWSSTGPALADIMGQSMNLEPFIGSTIVLEGERGTISFRVPDPNVRGYFSVLRRDATHPEGMIMPLSHAQIRTLRGKLKIKKNREGVDSSPERPVAPSSLPPPSPAGADTAAAPVTERSQRIFTEKTFNSAQELLDHIESDLTKLDGAIVQFEDKRGEYFFKKLEGVSDKISGTNSISAARATGFTWNLANLKFHLGNTKFTVRFREKT